MKKLTLPVVAVLALSALIFTPAAGARGQLKPVGWGPLTSAQAAKRVHGPVFEPRPQNRGANHRIPGRRQLAVWRVRSDLIYGKYVDGRFRGTTDEIIHWAAIKWGLPVNVLRSVAVVESWWRQSPSGTTGTRSASSRSVAPTTVGAGA